MNDAGLLPETTLECRRYMASYWLNLGLWADFNQSRLRSQTLSAVRKCRIQIDMQYASRGNKMLIDWELEISRVGRPQLNILLRGVIKTSESAGF